MEQWFESPAHASVYYFTDLTQIYLLLAIQQHGLSAADDTFRETLYDILQLIKQYDFLWGSQDDPFKIELENILTKYTTDEVEEAKGKIKRIEVRKKEYRLLKEKLEEHFNFEITDYIIDDILDYETYRHTCLMINLAVISNRISIENGEILKAGLKIIFKIKNKYDRFNRNVYIDTFDFDSWYDKYSTEEIVDIKKFLNMNDINLLKKLNIKIKNKIYTEQEVEILNMDLLSYYVADDMDEDELKQSKLLPKDVSREEYNNLLEKINKISEDYKF